MEVRKEFDRRVKELESLRSENALFERLAKEREDTIVELASRLDVVSESLEFLEEVSNSRRGTMKGRIESILTEALQLVYGKDRKVELSYSIKNNRSHLSIEVVKKTADGDVRRVINGEGSGLGVSDTVSVPLRLLVLLGSKKADRVCVLDECYKHMDVGRFPVIVQFLKALTDIARLNMQIVLLSHHELVREAADVSYEVLDLGGKSIVRKNP